MCRFLITLDGGTTNTRAMLWDEQAHLLHMVKSGTGVKNTAENGGNHRLKEAVNVLLEELLAKQKITYHDISAIYACGMLTSNVGLVEIPHLTAPAGLHDYVNGVVRVLIPEICPLPVSFIPGMKNMKEKVTMENLESMDIMRGEETETLALMDQLSVENGCLFILPGSHTKFITVDGAGRMTGCLTSMAGELLEAVTKHTVIADSVNRGFAPEKYDRRMLLEGCRKTWKSGFSRTAFLARILGQFTDGTPDERAAFLLGAVLAEDITAVKNSEALSVHSNMKVVVAGKEPLSGAICDVFQEDGYFKSVEQYSLSSQLPLSGYGAFLVARECGYRRK